MVVTKAPMVAPNQDNVALLFANLPLSRICPDIVAESASIIVSPVAAKANVLPKNWDSVNICKRSVDPTYTVPLPSVRMKVPTKKLL
mmetsp:Transcript_4169/g.8040  ORF Transcript_4169/g.8040 Transcript_4169/m.8040 type:complete len:87 (-) Transcript_4169:492-752(-)